MSTEGFDSRRPFGLFELDETGMVVYCQIESEDGTSQPAQEMTGRNFFKEVEPFVAGHDLPSQIASFARSTIAADSFHSTFVLDSNPLPIRVLLARGPGEANRTRAKSILVQIKRVPSQ
jgi:hypothetical protein